MTEFGELTITGLTLDLLRSQIEGLIRTPNNHTLQTQLELVKLTEALTAPDGATILFDFTRNS